MLTLLEHDGIFEDPQAIEHECQSCKHPLNISVKNTEWNDEQNAQYCNIIQDVLPVQEVIEEDVLNAEREKKRYWLS